MTGGNAMEELRALACTALGAPVRRAFRRRAKGREKRPVHRTGLSLSKKVTGRWPFFSLEILELRERMRYTSEG